MDNFLSFLRYEFSFMTELMGWLLAFGFGFYLVSRLFPGSRKQPFFRKDMPADILYWILGPLLYGFIFVVIINAAMHYQAFRYINNHGVHYLSSLPIIIQAALILLVGDFFQYWIHRLFHMHASLWPFHAVHHSSKHVDWLSSSRFHPINTILYTTSVSAAITMVGFAPEAFALLVPFNMIYSPLVHANLDWNYGPFKYLLASPVYHRWHHTKSWEGGNKNFAPTFPFLDLMFGTYYMPEGKLPMDFGLDEDTVPDSFHGQLLSPFRKPKMAAEPTGLQVAEPKP